VKLENFVKITAVKVEENLTFKTLVDLLTEIIFIDEILVLLSEYDDFDFPQPLNRMIGEDIILSNLTPSGTRLPRLCSSVRVEISYSQ